MSNPTRHSTSPILWLLTGIGISQLLIIPTLLIGGSLLFYGPNAQKDRDLADRRAQTDRDIADRRAQTDRDIAHDNLRDSALQTYYNKMSDLMITDHLRTAGPQSEVHNIAYSRTLSVLAQLDTDRKAQLIRFLQYADIIRGTEPAVSLQFADLSGANLQQANLQQANLQQANLQWANLQGANLTKANLTKANLEGATVTQAQLDACASLQGATMPDGSTHP